MRLVHLSDIHFGEEEIDRPDDPNFALRADLIEHIKEMRARHGPATSVLISGDVANKGRRTE
jgi:3',5'-cyclic AMP phosphodiesterase CpdA